MHFSFFFKSISVIRIKYIFCLFGIASLSFFGNSYGDFSLEFGVSLGVKYRKPIIEDFKSEPFAIYGIDGKWSKSEDPRAEHGAS